MAGQGEEPRGHDEGPEKERCERQGWDDAYEKGQGARWEDGGGLAGGKRTGDLAQRGSEPRRKRRFVLG